MRFVYKILMYVMTGLGIALFLDQLSGGEGGGGGSKIMMPTSGLEKLNGKIDQLYQSSIELINLILELRGLSAAKLQEDVEPLINLQARFILLGAMDESHRSQVRGYSTAKSILQRLNFKYADNSAANIYRLLMQYYRYDKKPEGPISEHIGKMDEMRRQLANLNQKQSKEVHQVTLIGSLPSEYSSIMEVR